MIRKGQRVVTTVIEQVYSYQPATYKPKCLICSRKFLARQRQHELKMSFIRHGIALATLRFPNRYKSS